MNSEQKPSANKINKLKTATIDFSKEIADDMQALSPHLKVGLDELQNGVWFKDKKLLLVIAIGLSPLFIVSLFSSTDLKTAYWAFAFYFSAIWAGFFYLSFPTENIKKGKAIAIFATTAFISIAILLTAYKVPPFSWLISLISSDNYFAKTIGYVFGVGVPEELCKSIAIILILNQFKKVNNIKVKDVIFYGLISGLGFGIYEGVNYQMRANFYYAESSSQYYLLNMIRLTSLPFIHAIWSAIAAYFLSFAYLYPKRKKGLFLLAIGLPALLHGLYDTFTPGAVGLVFAVLSVAIFSIFLKKAQDFEAALQSDLKTNMPQIKELPFDGNENTQETLEKKML